MAFEFAEMTKLMHFLLYLLSLSTLMASGDSFMAVKNGGAESKEIIPVGVILELNSTVGSVSRRYISIAISDFYQKNAHYRTRISLYLRDSKNDVVVAASAATTLIQKEKVRAIIGPERSEDARFIIELGERAEVPIVSFSSTSPSLSPSKTPFFIRAAQSDSSQVKAITAIIKLFGWQEIVLIYEDTTYGNGFVPYITDALQDIYVRVPNRSVIYPSFNDYEILQELLRLMSMQTRVFLVHMTARLSSKLFSNAKMAGMMTEGYVWITTAGLSTLMDPMGSNSLHSRHGVLGVRPILPSSKQLEDFMKRLKVNDLNLFALWAYDTVFALAMAAEKTYENDVKTSAKSSLFYQTILNTKLKGLSGEFNLVHGELEAPGFEIYNVIDGKEINIGNWTENEGIWHYTKENKTMQGLEWTIWPGGSKDKPKGWVYPIIGTKMRIGVPMKYGFTEFVKVENDSHTGKIKPTGLAIDIFTAVLEKLPFALPHEFEAYHGYYDDLLKKIQLQEFDAVVGDTTITANRSLFVDFTFPYTESGVSMVVALKHDEKNNIWVFLKPLSLGLWLITGFAFIFTGLVIWILEHHINTEFRGPPHQQIGFMFWFSFSTLVFAHRERVVNNLTRFVLVIWLFAVLILTQSYTANLASMLTVQRMKPMFLDVEEIKRNGYLVGYQGVSYVKDLLINELKFDESKLRPYSTAEEYHQALSNWSRDGSGVAAIFDDIPCLKVFLAHYCSKYTMVGPTYKNGGLGFAFPIGSPLVSYVSRAILNVTEDKDIMRDVESKYFSDQGNCTDRSIPLSSESLSVYSFGGIFILTGATSLLSVLIYLGKFLYSRWRDSSASTHSYESSVWFRVVEMVKNFNKKDDPSLFILHQNASRVHPVTIAHHQNNTEEEATTRSGGHEVLASSVTSNQV